MKAKKLVAELNELVERPLRERRLAKRLATILLRLLRLADQRRLPAEIDWEIECLWARHGPLIEAVLDEHGLLSPKGKR
ncbi:MAG: hypothetical protein KatS3mg105_3321 [Gemmatales bacterium]|nr:MAG: hypothetical protein KatS3mg105_3321 [Gemmatales bacterium]